MISDLKFMETLQPVFICRYMPSGTIYLHSLLDGHQEVLTIPGVLNLDALYVEKLNSPEESLDLILKANPYFYDTSKMDEKAFNNSGLFRLGENGDEGIVTDRNRFEQFYFEFMKGTDTTPRNVILAVYYAYARSHNQIIKDKKVILYHPHGPLSHVNLYKIFSKGKTIVTIRHPLKGYTGTIKLLKQRATLRGFCSIHLGVLLSEINAATFFGREDIEVRFVRVEDLSNHKEYILRELCKYIGIQYDATLESSTFGGKKYWGANTQYKSNQFLESRHNFPLVMSKRDRVILTLVNKRLSVIKGYKLDDISVFYRVTAFFWLLIPMEEDIKLAKELFVQYPWKRIFINSGKPFSRIRILLSFMKERLKTILYYYQYTQRLGHYCDKLCDNMIRSDSEF
jgi:hypothetical protein